MEAVAEPVTEVRFVKMPAAHFAAFVGPLVEKYPLTSKFVMTDSTLLHFHPGFRLLISGDRQWLYFDDNFEIWYTNDERSEPVISSAESSKKLV